MGPTTMARTAGMAAIAFSLMVLVLTGCERKKDPKVSSGSGASSQAVLTLKGAAR